MKNKWVFLCCIAAFLSTACASLPQPSGQRVPINENHQAQEVFKAQ